MAGKQERQGEAGNTPARQRSQSRASSNNPAKNNLSTRPAAAHVRTAENCKHEHRKGKEAEKMSRDTWEAKMIAAGKPWGYARNADQAAAAAKKH